MEFFLRFLQIVIKFVYYFVNGFLERFYPKNDPPFPPIRNSLLVMPMLQLMGLMREKKLTSTTLVKAYINRIKEVNPIINAVVEERFAAALVDAARIDKIIQNTPDTRKLFADFKILGIPFTVKESCGVRGLSHVVGSLNRLGMKSREDGDTVALLRAAGGIPLLVSTNPEYCFSIETNSFTNGITKNPYDLRRTCGGSSGGEGALNGAGATVFGVGSDIAGSIRIPALFCGVFGHKPTGGVTSVRGHFPDSDDPDFQEYLQIGPITRYASDLTVLLFIMAGANAPRLNLLREIKTPTIKIHFYDQFEGLNGWMHHRIQSPLTNCFAMAIAYLKYRVKCNVKRVHFQGFRDSTEIALSGIVRLKGFPYLLNNPHGETALNTVLEFLKSMSGKSRFTKNALVFELMRRTNAFMFKKNLIKYKEKARALKAEIINELGDMGVLLLPTFHVHAIHHNTSILPLWGIDYAAIINILGLPATHITLGLDRQGLPIGIQVVAAPYNDALCLHIAAKLEFAFGGWVPPSRNWLEH